MTWRTCRDYLYRWLGWDGLFHGRVHFEGRKTLAEHLKALQCGKQPKAGSR